MKSPQTAASVFGAVHAYQGPFSALETCLSGLVYGAVRVLGSFTIWPAALAHGMGNTLGLRRLFYAAL